MYRNHENFTKTYLKLTKINEAEKVVKRVCDEPTTPQNCIERTDSMDMRNEETPVAAQVVTTINNNYGKLYVLQLTVVPKKNKLLLRLQILVVGIINEYNVTENMKHTSGLSF